MKLTNNFIIKALKEGKKIKRKSWQDGDYFSDDSYLGCIKNPDSFVRYISPIRIEDIEANDWEIVEQ